MGRVLGQWAALNGSLPQGIAYDLAPAFAEPNPYAPDYATWAEAMNPQVLPSLVLDSAHRTVSVAQVVFTANPSTDSSADYGPLMAAYLLSAVP